MGILGARTVMLRQDCQEQHGSAGPTTPKFKCVAIFTKLKMLLKDLLMKKK